MTLVKIVPAYFGSFGMANIIVINPKNTVVATFIGLGIEKALIPANTAHMTAIFLFDLIFYLLSFLLVYERVYPTK